MIGNPADHLKRLGKVKKEYEAKVVDNYDARDGTEIRFIIPELTPLTHGHLTDNKVPLKRTYTTLDGKVITVRANHQNHFIGTYSSNDGFRKTPPNVQRNETIIVWQDADTDRWFWKESTQDVIAKRRLETVVHGVNADKQKGKAKEEGGFSPNNSYYTEMSSENQTYTIKTSNVNGEKSKYTIQINAKEGCIVICDDENNRIELDTVNKQIQLTNEFDTEVLLDKNDIKVKCNGEYNEKVGKNKTVTISGSCNINIEGSANIKVGGSTTLDCGNTKITGNVEIGGNLAVKGDTTLHGGGNMKGNISVDGQTKLNSSLTVAGSSKLSGGTSSGVIHGSYIDT